MTTTHDLELRTAWDEASRYRTLADTIDQGLCIVECLFDDCGEATDYRFLEVNRSFEQQTGLSNAVGRRMLELAPNHEHFWIETYCHVATSGEPIRFEHQADALGRWFDVFAFRVREPESHQVAILFSDISERVRIVRALKDAERRKDEFLAVLAHELRNPLAPIRASLRTMSTVCHEAAIQKSMSIIERQFAHLTKLVDELSDIGRIACGDTALDLDMIDLRDCIASSVEIARPAIEVRAQSFMEILPEACVTTCVDSRRIAQAVSNLLLNASKYTRCGGNLRLALVVARGRAVIEVSDDGVGIPAHRLADIFEMFSQVESARQHSQGGLGIGLALTKRIADLHGGSVAASSEGVGRGSTFRLELPLRRGQA